MSKRLTVTTEIRVLEEDETTCAPDCPHLVAFPICGAASRCELYDIWLDPTPRKTGARCRECVEEAKRE